MIEFGGKMNISRLLVLGLTFLLFDIVSQNASAQSRGHSRRTRVADAPPVSVGLLPSLGVGQVYHEFQTCAEALQRANSGLPPSHLDRSFDFYVISSQAQNSQRNSHPFESASVMPMFQGTGVDSIYVGNAQRHGLYHLSEFFTNPQTNERGEHPFESVYHLAYQDRIDSEGRPNYIAFDLRWVCTDVRNAASRNTGSRGEECGRNSFGHLNGHWVVENQRPPVTNIAQLPRGHFVLKPVATGGYRDPDINNEQYRMEFVGRINMQLNELTGHLRHFLGATNPPTLNAQSQALLSHAREVLERCNISYSPTYQTAFRSLRTEVERVPAQAGSNAVAADPGHRNRSGAVGAH